MKNIEYVSKVLAKKHNISEKNAEKITNFVFNHIIDNMKESKYDAIYLLKLGTFHIDKILLFKYLKRLIYIMRNLKKKNTNKSKIIYENYCLEFRKLWLIRKRLITKL